MFYVWNQFEVSHKLSWGVHCISIFLISIASDLLSNIGLLQSCYMTYNYLLGNITPDTWQLNIILAFVKQAIIPGRISGCKTMNELSDREGRAKIWTP